MDAGDLGGHGDLLLQLERREVDAILVHDLLSPTEVARAVAGLDAVRDDAATEMFGHVLGMPLMRLGDGEQDRTPYYDSTVAARELCTTAFGFDPHDRVRSVVEQMSGGLPLVVPEEDGRKYNPGTVRWYLENQGGLYPHVGNEFVQQNENGALTHLLTVNQIRDWISWFMVLRRPRAGGTLTVYDLLHEDRPDDIDDPAAREALFASLDSVTFDPDPGTAIFFCGGWRYHRVEDIEGPIPRMTYGGFMRPDRERRAINLWA